MRNRTLPEPLILGFNDQDRETMRQALPQRQAIWRQQVAKLIDAMDSSDAPVTLADIRRLVSDYPDRDAAADDLQRAADRYREVTGRRAPRRLTQLA